MATPLLDPAAIAKVRADIQAARNGLITDRVLVLERAIDILFDALKAAK